MKNTIESFKKEYKIVIPTSGIYKGNFKDIIKDLPEIFFSKFLFDTESKKYYRVFSKEYKSGFHEVSKNKIVEPNIKFIEAIKNGTLFID